MGEAEDARAYVPWDLAEAFMVDALVGYGMPRADARICVDVVLESDRRGIESHGCNRFKPLYLDRIRIGTLKPKAHIEVVRETPTTLVLDAHDGSGMVASHRMMKSLMGKACAYGMAGGAVRGSTHYGIAGYWACMAAKEGLVGITGTNARSMVAPTFGVENMYGTNPLCFALPTDEEFPFCIDCATSIVQRGRIEYYAREGRETPSGMAVGQGGEDLRDSARILKALDHDEAALLPLGGQGEGMGGHKGYGWAIAVEILSAALSGGAFLKDLSGFDADGKPRPFDLCHFFVVMDPEAFAGQATFERIAGDICRELRASKREPGQPRIYTAGEKEWLAWQRRKAMGVPLTRSVQKEFVAVRDELGLPYRFPFEDAA